MNPRSSWTPRGIAIWSSTTRFAGVFCAQCGHKNPAEANFCSSCGAKLEAETDVTMTHQVLDLGDHQREEDMTEAMGELASKDAMLYVKRGPNVGATYLLDVDVVRAGRHPESEVFLDDVTVSRKHAEFRREGEHFFIKDVGSLNGTYLNGERVDSQQLRSGDEVQIGKYKLVFLASTSQQ